MRSLLNYIDHLKLKKKNLTDNFNQLTKKPHGLKFKKNIEGFI